MDLNCSAVNITATLLLPHFQSIMNLSFSELISGVMEAIRRQVSSGLCDSRGRNPLTTTVRSSASVTRS